MAGAITQALNIDFPYDFDEDGCCEKYDKDRGCTAYEERPDFCRTDKGQQKSGLSEEEYNKKAALACNTMIDILQIDESFKLPE